MADHRACVRDYYRFVDQEAYEDLLGLFAEDVTYHRPGQDPIEGIADLRAFSEDRRPLEDGEHAIHAVLVDGDTAAVRGTFTGAQDGAPVSFGFADFHRLDPNGDITGRHTYTDRDTV